MSIDICPCPHTRLIVASPRVCVCVCVCAQVGQSFTMQQQMGLAKEGDEEDLKRVLLEGNPYFLVSHCKYSGDYYPCCHTSRSLDWR
jgi:hypothetical protein